MKVTYIVEDLTDDEAQIMKEAMLRIAEEHGVSTVEVKIITMDEAQKEEGIRI